MNKQIIIRNCSECPYVIKGNTIYGKRDIFFYCENNNRENVTDYIDAGKFPDWCNFGINVYNQRNKI